MDHAWQLSLKSRNCLRAAALCFILVVHLFRAHVFQTFEVHEFISWLTKQGTAVKAVQDTKQKNVTVHIINPSDRVSKRFTFTFNGCKNMAFPLGNPAEFLLRLGEEVSKVLLDVVEKGKSWKWNYRWSSRSEFAGVEDDPNAFQDGEFLHDNSSIGESSTKFHVGSPEVWVRARALGDPAEAVLFDQIRPQDIVQGQSGGLLVAVVP